LGKQSHNLVLNDSSTFDLTIDIKVALLLEFVDDWNSKRPHRLSLR
jgi:hypothetical protein